MSYVPLLAVLTAIDIQSPGSDTTTLHEPPHVVIRSTLRLMLLLIPALPFFRSIDQRGITRYLTRVAPK